ncbi:prenyltransferase and squalene oxidase [Drepanopeziza brunnea f. sp. 'multigermtubi' MB_m1]|uniref:Protein farnesyltransferase subunit beta n=1 Tax=Marssonina brunnea f. sp. multigermtubi (strain MB_m1) TaxID=1072389 RepID=K1XHX5_MARBU|nr:prenyltransferase and squalene oxidase [Drepanopeziza brunnea f. sp. 'multigermtubi' MB_m1]EKD20363.1 prenyltransferase and squalene oxidase [Drepanopeziza brunnea f. sp. 'multigermtubi' MB_m1]
MSSAPSLLPLPLPVPSGAQQQTTRQSGFIVEGPSPSDSDSDFDIDSVVVDPVAEAMSTKTARATMVPDIFTQLPPCRDLHITESSQVQDETVQEVLPFLSGQNSDVETNEHGVPRLARDRHISFLHKSLGRLPSGYVAADASRPWMFYWALNGLATLGEDVSEYRQRVINTVRPIQNATGGFGGGNGQMSHLAPTYAILLSLAIVGESESMELIDRKSMWKWLSILKQPSGGFQMSVGGEEDVRGAYIAAVIIVLLDLPLELHPDSPAWTKDGATLLTGLPEWISRCQTFEGGMSARPDVEAHGAYAFCALACLSILGDPQDIIPKYLDVPLLISWLSARQYAPDSGFSGRTNKLVDGCYSHWVGGCWPLLEACLNGNASNPESRLVSITSDGKLFSREGLIRYILCCCQDQTKRGGLRDKPSHSSDSYHTCYVLAGLTSAQNNWYFDASASGSSGFLSSAFQWTSEPIIDDSQIFDEEDRIGTLHPVFVIPQGTAEEMRAYFTSRGGF